MPTTIAQSPLQSNAPSAVARARTWRSFLRIVADVVCREEAAGDVRRNANGSLNA